MSPLLRIRVAPLMLSLVMGFGIGIDISAAGNRRALDFQLEPIIASESLDGKVREKLFREFNASIYDDKIDLNFQGYNLRLFYHQQLPEVLFRIIGTDQNGFAIDLLRFRVDLHRKAAVLESLDSDETKRPIPTEKTGSYKLQFADALAMCLELTSIRLIDESEVICQRTGNPVNLKLLKLFQKGQTWYEANGYQYLGNHLDSRKRVDQLLAYEISDMRLHLDIEEAVVLFENSLNDFKSSLSDLKSTKACDFMAWLWERDSKAYSKIMQIMEPVFEGILKSKSAKMIKAFDATVSNETKAKSLRRVPRVFKEMSNLGKQTDASVFKHAVSALGLQEGQKGLIRVDRVCKGLSALAETACR